MAKAMPLASVKVSKVSLNERSKKCGIFNINLGKSFAKIFKVLFHWQTENLS